MPELQTGNRDTILKVMYRAFERHREVLPDEWDALTAICDTVTVPAKTGLQNAGDDVSHIYFLTRGLIRVFYVAPDGRQHNKNFYKENNIVGSLSILVVEEPARFFIETLEDSDLVCFPVKKIRDMLPENRLLEAVVQHSSLKMMARNERREAELLMLSAKERYNRFARNFPDLLERIPQYHIASYLGITPVALSRYKGQWSTSDED